MVVYKYNRIGTEGVDSEGYSGVNFQYTSDYPENIMRGLRAKRKVVLVWLIEKSKRLNYYSSLLEKIRKVALKAINEAPPQIAPDLIEDGVVLTGGLALMPGLKEYLQEELKIAIHLSTDPLLDISKGAWLIMQNYASYNQGL